MPAICLQIVPVCRMYSCIGIKQILKILSPYKICSKNVKVWFRWKIPAWKIGYSPNVTEARSFFWQCTNLQTVDLSKWNPQNIVNLQFFFYECHNLQSFRMEGWNVPTLKSLQQTFANCYQLEVIDLSSWSNINSLDDLYAAFSSCSNLKTLKIPNIKSGYKDMFFLVYF